MIEPTGYESPVTMYETPYEVELVDYLTAEVQKSVGFHIDTDELLKCLRYDRDSYNNGYQAGRLSMGWVKCSEALPSNNKQIVLMFPDGSIHIGFYDIRRTLIGESKFCYNNGGVPRYIGSEEVDSWLPIPD